MAVATFVSEDLCNVFPTGIWHPQPPLPLRFRLHEELAYEERHAHSILTRFFEHEPPAAAWTVQPHYELPTAFRAEWEPAGGPEVPSAGPRPLHLGFLCEYDALPGIGHACGHNLIAEVGAAAALGVKGALESLLGPPPPVKVFGDQ
ncbi:peptidase M20 domain-containing protein 2-like [Choloepus didactylus]|uniref:peptidase M20 domain-containing protein 2-like n=1 Tax=Choloepus didactylus TaxID=27675 RepID=UPI00189E265C|nr:peptidase M20 domain-containing protein 2-like [Choloepus didactylus]